MKRLALIVAILASVPTLASAQTPNADAKQGDVASLAVGTVHEALFGVALVGNSGVAVGVGGDIRESGDGGKTWKPIKSPSTQTLLGVTTDGSKAVAVGMKGTVLLRDAQGVWTSVQSGTDSRLLSVAMNGAGTAVAVGAFGALIKSSDGGAHWEALTPKWADFSADGAEPNLYGVSVAVDGAVTVAGEFGVIMQSRDGGATFESRHKGEATLFGLDLGKDGNGYAVGQGGSVLKTTDQGKSWTEVDIGSKVNLLSVKANADGTIYATGMHEILAGRSDGQPWHQLSDDLANGLWHTSLAASDGANHVIGVGQAGQILQLGK